MKLIQIINTISNVVCDLFMIPARAASAWPALLVSSLVFAVIALLAFKYCSDQDALRRSKGKLIAHILEIQLFKDDLWSIFATFVQILASVALYMKETLKPLLIILIPMLLFLFQMGTWFEHRPLQPGDSAHIQVKLEEGWLDAGNTLQVKHSEGITMDAAPFIFPAENEMIWRFDTDGTDAQWLEVHAGGDSIRKEVATGSRMTKIPVMRSGDSMLDALLNPLEAPIRAELPINSVSVSYPERTISILGMNMHWIVALFIVSLVFGLGLKYPMRVDF